MQYCLPPTHNGGKAQFNQFLNHALTYCLDCLISHGFMPFLYLCIQAVFTSFHYISFSAKVVIKKTN